MEDIPLIVSYDYKNKWKILKSDLLHTSLHGNFSSASFDYRHFTKFNDILKFAPLV